MCHGGRVGGQGRGNGGPTQVQSMVPHNEPAYAPRSHADMAYTAYSRVVIILT